MRTVVVVMSKIPQPGFTKTRLMSVLSERECSDFHRACLADTCRAIRKSRLPGYIYYAAESRNVLPADVDEIWGLPTEERAYFEFRPQQGKDLGERLCNAAREILICYEAVLFLGSDMPQITSDAILEAEVMLSGSDTVLGPAHDGGYYLLGIKQVVPNLFEDIPWGTSQVLEKTLEKIIENKFACSLLRPQADIDTWDDLKEFFSAGIADENSVYRRLTAYRLAAELIQKHG